MIQPGFTIEIAHVAGLALGVLFAGGNSVTDALTAARSQLCETHFFELRSTCRMLVDEIRRVEDPPS